MAGDSAGLSVRRLGPSDLPLLLAAQGVFDDAVRPDKAQRFLAHPDHHLFAAINDAAIVGFVSAVTYLHPDKPLECWINEAGVADGRQRRGIGRQLLLATLAHAWLLGCEGAWVLTNSSNRAARGLYAACGGEATPAARHGEGVIMFSFRLKPAFTLALHSVKRSPHDLDERHPPQLPRSLRQGGAYGGAISAAGAAE